VNPKPPADRRFHRSAARLARQRRGRLGRWLRRGARLLVVVAVAYGGTRAAALVRSAPELHVERIVLRGHERLSAGEVLSVLDGLRGQHMLGVSLSRWQARLIESPWIESAALRRVLPSTIEVFIAERHPMGVARLAGQAFLVDRHGIIVDEYGPAYGDLDLPIIDGLGTAPRDGSTVDEVRADLAARLIDSMRARPDLARRLSQIDVRDAEDAVVILDGDPALIHLGRERFLERLVAYVGIAPALRQRVPVLDYVDMRYGERIFVRPADGARPRPPS
jgi:cell division protein FtsQ